MKPLHFKEIEILINETAPQLVGATVERIFVPLRTFVPAGFFKNEWVMRVASSFNPGQSSQFGQLRKMDFVWSVRAQMPYFYLTQTGKVSLKAAAYATRSGFDLVLNKTLQGSKIKSVRVLNRDRYLLFEFEPTELNGQSRNLGLLINLIPALTESYLVDLDQSEASRYFLLGRSKTKQQNDLEKNPFLDLLSAKRSEKQGDIQKFETAFSSRFEHLENLELWPEQVEAALRSEAGEDQVLKLKRENALRLKQISLRVRQCESNLKLVEKESDYEKSGHLLKASLHEEKSQKVHSSKTGFYREVYDYESENWVNVAVHQNLTLSEEVTKQFELAKRKRRKVEETQLRLESFRIQESELVQLDAELDGLQKDGKQISSDLKTKIELKLGLRVSAQAGPGEEAQKGKASSKPNFKFKGKCFQSADGLFIYCGRSKVENLELTFKIARGNDIWLHLKAKPGAHVVVSLANKKSASLETLLDAATVCLYYSSGAGGGKAAVDYTFRKYVKRIKDSSEASYTQEKTLTLEFDAKRWEKIQAREVIK